jgi:nitrite reductase (NO-forming)
MDYHVSAGMFGMVVVEPPGGLPEVDRERYFGQHAVYTDGADGHQTFDREAMRAEDPNYVVLNGEAYALAADRGMRGVVLVGRGEEERVTPLGFGLVAGLGGVTVLALLRTVTETMPTLPETNPG